MKKQITLLSFAFFLTTSALFCQTSILAKDLIKDIKSGKNISLKNTTIEGVLDLTFMEEKKESLPKRKKSWWGNYSSNTVENLIETKLSFVNCTFKDDVLAYIPDSDNSGYTFIASFESDAIFKDCTFEGKAMFKYSNFESESSFENAIFKDDTTFKYAKFDNFISFENSKFSESATFKYSKFSNGISFKNAKFDEDLNIKYAKISGNFDVKGMKVGFDIDSKYTTVNGKSFSKFLLENQ